MIPAPPFEIAVFIVIAAEILIGLIALIAVRLKG